MASAELNSTGTSSWSGSLRSRGRCQVPPRPRSGSTQGSARTTSRARASTHEAPGARTGKRWCHAGSLLLATVGSWPSPSPLQTLGNALALELSSDVRIAHSRLYIEEPRRPERFPPPCCALQSGMASRRSDSFDRALPIAWTLWLRGFRHHGPALGAGRERRITPSPPLWPWP